MYRLLTFVMIISLVACQPENQDSRFKAFLSTHQYWRSQLWSDMKFKNGFPEFGDLLPLVNEDLLSARLVFCENQLIALHKIDQQQLSPPFKFEHNKIRQFLEKTIHDLEVAKIQETDAARYSLSPFFEKLLNREYSSPEQKIALLKQNLQRLPAYYEIAKSNLKSSSPQSLETALEQETALYFNLEKEVPPIFSTARANDKRALQDELLSKAKIALKDYIAFLNSLKFELHNQKTDSLSRLPNRYPIKKRTNK